MLQSHPSNLAPIVPLSPTSSISATPSPPAGFSLAWNWEMRQFVSEETFLCTKDCCRMDLNPNLQNLSIFNWCGGCLRCRTHHPCLDSHATPWKNVSSFNLAIWSVLVLYHLNQFYISYISNSTSTSNQSGWINWLGWKRLRFRWQHPDSRGKLDAVTWIPKRSLKILRRPILPKCSKVILQTSHQSCDFPPTSSILGTPSPPAGFSLAWNWEMRQCVSEETSFVPKIVVEWI